MMITIMQDASLTAATAVPRAWVVLLAKHTAKLASALIRTQRHLHPSALKLRIKVMAYATMIIIMQNASLTAATAVPRAWVVLSIKHTATLASALIRTQRHLHPSALKLRIKVMAYATTATIMRDASLTAATAVPRAWVVLS